jgi:methylated-DNA-[protein]-cysteine S-methyltransferase
MEIFTGYYVSPIGCLEIKAAQSNLLSVKFMTNDIQPDINLPNCEIIEQTISQLDEYFNHNRKEFDLALHFNGSDFQVKVWKELLEIPYGITTSYGKIALKLGSFKKTRAVGFANGKNPLAIVVPCHRVIGENGDLVGYAGGLWRKKWLLELESGEKQLHISF